MSGATLTDAVTGELTGTPASLPSNWQLLGGYLIGPDAYLANANLRDVDLTATDVSGADLDDADLAGATLTGVDLSTSQLEGVSSGGIIGTPAGLPVNWSLLSGYLVGPTAYLNGAGLADADLAGLDLYGISLASSDLSSASLDNANLTNANLTGADLSGAELSDVIWSNTTCPDGTNSVNDNGTCINNLA